MNSRPILCALLACAAIATPTLALADKFNQPQRLPLVESGATNPEAMALLKSAAAGGYRFTPALRDAYLEYVIGEAQRELAGKSLRLPDEFLVWVKSDPVVCKTVYGTRAQPLRTLLWLRSLELDLGKEAVRGEYTQLALAMAVVAAAQDALPDVTPREPLKLVIPTGPPNGPVNTKPTDRSLDRDDHIVNFFKDHAKITAAPIGGAYRVLPELEYDDNGVARSLSAGEEEKKGKNSAKPVLREITPADVLASRELQVDFNEYMKKQGIKVEIDCGERVIHPAMKDRNSIKQDPHYKGILAAYSMFKEAFEKKGLLALRDTLATPAERCAYLIRNDREQRSGSKKLPGNPPSFSLQSPWPALTLLVANNTPLREREALRQDYVATGKLHTYGEYIGAIAQDGTLQSARRLAPYQFGYGSVQMQLKDGGVCGTMANICVSSFNMLGVPSCTAGQPGHCALIYVQADKDGKYQFLGKQYATGGDEVTHPASPWVFADTDVRRDMIYNQSIGWAMNVGFPAFLDTQVAYDVFRMMPAKDRAKHGSALLGDALAMNPFNISLAEAGIKAAPTVKETLTFFATTRKLAEAATEKAGAKPLYLRQLAKFADARVKALPKDAASEKGVQELQAFLESTRPLTKAEKQAAKEAAKKSKTPTPAKP